MRTAIAVSFENDCEIEAEIKSYLKMGWFKTGRSFQMIITMIFYQAQEAAMAAAARRAGGVPRT